MLGPQASVVLKNGAQLKSRNVDLQGKASLSSGSAIDALKAFEVRYKASVDAQEASRISTAKLSNFGEMQANQSQFVVKDGLVTGRIHLTNHAEANMRNLKTQAGSQVSSVDSTLRGQQAEINGKVSIKNGAALFEDSLQTGMNSETKLDHAQIKTGAMTHAGNLKVKNGGEITCMSHCSCLYMSMIQFSF